MAADREARVERCFEDLAHLLEKEDRMWLVTWILRDATREQAALLRKVDELERQVEIHFWLRRQHEHGRLELGHWWDGASGNGRTWFTSKKAERAYVLKQALSNGREAWRCQSPITTGISPLLKSMHAISAAELR